VPLIKPKFVLGVVRDTTDYGNRALKDSIDSMTSAELDQLDVTSNTHRE
jgi:hypothetical protein